MELSLPAWLGALCGMIVAAVIYVPGIRIIERRLRAANVPETLEQRSAFEDKLSVMRRVLLGLAIAVLAVAGYWIGNMLGGTLGGAGGRHEIGSGRPLGVPQGVLASLCVVVALLLQAQSDGELSVREKSDFASLSRRTRAATLSQRRTGLHRVQIERGDMSGTGDYDRGRPAPKPRYARRPSLCHR